MDNNTTNRKPGLIIFLKEVDLILFENDYNNTMEGLIFVDAEEIIEDQEEIQHFDPNETTAKELNSQDDLAFSLANDGETHESAQHQASHIAWWFIRWDYIRRGFLMSITMLLSSWKGIHFHALPTWMQDNDFLLQENRPHLPSFAACFKSIFRLHTETGNIWTHLIGCASVLMVAIYFLTRPEHEIEWEHKFAFVPFFFGAIACMGLSFVFHTFYCHSKTASKIFLKLDYVGISLQFIGSFTPWLYYAFYCHTKPRIFYITAILIFSSFTIYVSLLCEEFSTVAFRPKRVLMFSILGLWGILPALHMISMKGFWIVFYEYSLCWILLMGLVYFIGAGLYVCRIPERYLIGYCDIWVQSHQIFHVAIVIATYIHYYGIKLLAEKRMKTQCGKNLSEK